MKRLIPLCLFYCFSCFSINIETLMTPEEQKETGYSSLTKEEKKNLSLWIAKNFELISKKETEGPLSLNINIQSGKQIILSDGSKWEVDPEDYETSSIWLTPIPLKLTKNGSQEYPYLLTNIDQPKEKIKVRPTS